MEEETEESFDRVVEEVAQGLARSWMTLVVTGTFGGLEICIGGMIYWRTGTRRTITCWRG